MRRCIIVVSFVFLLCDAIPATAQEPPMERILVPIPTAGLIEGAYGTVWVNRVLVFNDTQAPITFRQVGCDLLVPRCGDRRSVAPGDWTTVVATQGRTTPGSFIHVPASAATDLHFGGTLRELSRAEESPGTQLPIVRADDFDNRIILVELPFDGSVRGMLRIYKFDESPGIVRLRIFDLTSASPLVDTEVTLLAGAISTRDGLPEHPAYSQIDLLAEFPVLAAFKSLRVELDGRAADAKLWAFASITNNITQQLTIVTPQ